MKLRYTHALRGSRAPYNPRAVSLGLELLCNACPFGALLVDSDHHIIFANREGTELLSRWNISGEQPLKFAALRVPREIQIACDRLRSGFPEGPKRRVRPRFGGRVFVRHSVNENLSAVVALERSPRDRRVALFCVFVHDRLKTNLVSGRRDQLTMLTVAERRVAKLVAEGLRNQEIAAALGKSITTVKSQLVTIFGKLQIRSRVQLVGLLQTA